MNKLQKFIWPLALIVFIFGSGAEVFAQSDIPYLPIKSYELADLIPVAPREPQGCDIVAQIDAFRSDMASASLSVSAKNYTYIEKRAGQTRIYTEPQTEIMLGLLNPTSCERRLVKVIKKGDKLTAPSGYDIEPVTRVNGIRWNYWNTIYKINSPEGWFVAANTYPIQESRTVTKSIRNKYGRTVTKTEKAMVNVPVFYVTFSEELNQPEFVKLGQEYMSSLAKRALEKLRESKVISRAFPGVLLANTIIAKPEWLARLAPIEHTDMTELILDPEWAFSRAYVQIGLNREGFASYTCSRASACGLMQLTDSSLKDKKGRLLPGTYTLLRKAYPDAGLNPDFLTGARDPLNAMMAAFLHNDDIMRKLIATLGQDVTSDLATLEELIAAGYNSGDRYIIPAYKAKLTKNVSDWTEALPSCKRNQREKCLPLETKEYIAAKLRYLRKSWLAFVDSPNK